MTRMVFKQPEEADGLEAIAAHEGWTATAAVEATEDNPLEIVWVTSHDTTIIRYIEDQNAGFAYLQLEGSQAEALADRFSSSFDFWTPRQIVELSLNPRDDEDAANAAMLAGLCAPEQVDQLFRSVIERELRHPSPSVRAHAIQAIAYPAWPEFTDELTKLAADDPADRVRELAGRLARILREGSDR